jgi:hypothetical protein
VLASEVEIGDHVTFRGKEWDVTGVVHLDKGEQIHLELTHWIENNEEVTERFVLDPLDELEGDEDELEGDEPKFTVRWAAPPDPQPPAEPSGT